MKARIISLVTALATFAASLMPMAAAADVRDAHPSIADMFGAAPETVTESITINRGETFTITLDSNITTGYSWEVVCDKKYLKLVSSAYIHPKTNLDGAGGQEEFVFKAFKKGTTKLTLNYRRPWEVGVDPIEQRIYRVTILRNNDHRRGLPHHQAIRWRSLRSSTLYKLTHSLISRTPYESTNHPPYYGARHLRGIPNAHGRSSR